MVRATTISPPAASSTAWNAATMNGASSGASWYATGSASFRTPATGTAAPFPRHSAMERTSPSIWACAGPTTEATSYCNREGIPMLDEIAIQQTLNTYSEGASRADWEQVLSTFAPDGIWEVPKLNILQQGHAAIRALMQGAIAQFDYFVQFNSPAVIPTDGNRATAGGMFREQGKYAGGEGARGVAGHYPDQLARPADGWKSARRTFKSIGVQNIALSPPTP